MRKYSNATLGCMFTVETNTDRSEKSFPYSSPVPAGKLTILYLSLTSLQLLHKAIQKPIQNPSIFRHNSFCHVFPFSHERVNVFSATRSVSIAISKLDNHTRINVRNNFIAVLSMCSHTRFNAKRHIFDVCNSYSHVALRR